MKKAIVFSIISFFALVSFSQITEFGKASFYADKFDGRVTASGDIFNQKKMTAAHRTLPFGTLVKVINLDNKNSVEVIINDRGPFVDDRVIDLSRAAAEKLGFIKKGVADVKVEVISLKTNTSRPKKNTEKVKAKSTPEVTETKAVKNTNSEVVEYYKLESTLWEPKGFGIQVASYQEAANLMKRCDEIKQQVAKDVIIQVRKSNGNKVYRVMLGVFDTREEAAQFNKSIQKKYKGSFVKAF